MSLVFLCNILQEEEEEEEEDEDFEEDSDEEGQEETNKSHKKKANPAECQQQWDSFQTWRRKKR